MSVKYDLYESPSPKDGKEEKSFHARVVPYGTTSTDSLARRIHSNCSLTEGDVKAALIALSDAVEEELKSGNRVYLEGLGYFQMTLACPPVSSAGNIRAESIHFKSVSFVPEKELKDKLSVTTFVRAENKRHSAKLTDEEVEKRLTAYFSEHSYIIRSAFEHLCGFTRTMATEKLNALIKQGKLKKGGVHRFPIYEPVKGE